MDRRGPGHQVGWVKIPGKPGDTFRPETAPDTKGTLQKLSDTGVRLHLPASVMNVVSLYNCVFLILFVCFHL